MVLWLRNNAAYLPPEGKQESMTTCVPIKELKNTSKFTRIVHESSEPVTITKNGREAIIAMTPEQYDALRLEVARAKLYEIIDQAETDIAGRNLIDAITSNQGARARYGL